MEKKKLYVHPQIKCLLMSDEQPILAASGEASLGSMEEGGDLSKPASIWNYNEQ